MIHPDTELRFVSDAIGFGVFATRPIPRGSVTYALDPLEVRVPGAALDRLPALLRRPVDHYGYVDARGDYIVSWDHGKYVNHCCEANSLSTGWGFELAVRDIAAGEELTDDYGLFNVDAPLAVACPRCEACRCFVRPDDIETYADIWDGRIRAALDFYQGVPQPLASLLRPQVVTELEAFFAGRGRFRSVRELARPRRSLFPDDVPRLRPETPRPRARRRNVA